MITFDNIQTYATGFPATQYTFLGSPEEARTIPLEHKDQIFFLNEEATRFVSDYLDSSQMLTGPLWKPFNERYFKTINEFEVTNNCEAELKKWLYHKPISFDHFVFMYSNWGDQAVMLTWKMIIKYWDGLFSAYDLVLFDQTLNWGFSISMKIFYTLAVIRSTIKHSKNKKPGNSTYSNKNTSIRMNFILPARRKDKL